MTAPSRLALRGLTLPELERWTSALKLPPYRARQIFTWVHRHGATSLGEMTNLSLELREQLAAQVDLTPLVVEEEQRSADGTRKLRLRLADGAAIETVLIPDGEKLTQCLSSQVGCAWGCRFCSTARVKLLRNLETGEIIDQFYRARALLGTAARITNLVFMGMGEPLQNLDHVLAAVDILGAELGASISPRRITVSTAGHVPGIEELGRRNRMVGLAVSLNATTNEVRSQLMPINKRWPLETLLEALRRYPLPRRRRITFEYVLIAGVNDTAEDARRLPRLLDRIPAKINLIAYNPGRFASPYRPPTPAAIEAFAERLRAKDLATFVRESRGQDIAAACGQLVADRGDDLADRGDDLADRGDDLADRGDDLADRGDETE